MHSSLDVVDDSCKSEPPVAEPLDPLSLAERVAVAADEQGIATALIGGMALAAYNYVRATEDVDVATAVDPRTDLCRLEQSLQGLGLRTRLTMPDDDDPLGGVLRVWEHDDAEGDPIGIVEVVNFKNPHSRRADPAYVAIRDAVPLDEKTTLRCVRLPDLIALKFYSGGRQDITDIVELLTRNPGADLDEIPNEGQAL